MKENGNDGAPHVDFSMQFNFAKNSEKVEEKIFNILKNIVDQIAQSKLESLGALIVFGDFETHGPVVQGMVQMKPKQNPIESLKMIDTSHGIDCLIEYSQAPYDGAVVVDRTGQIIGAGIYLVVDDPLLDTPEDCGTRHKAAASFSKRNDVISVLTLSEETNVARIWKDGKLMRTYRFSDEDGKEISE